MNSNDLVNKIKSEDFNQIKFNADLSNIKSKLVLQKILNNLEKKKLYKIIKYNKNIQSRINININDYKEYSELIELEIKPVNNEYDKFINYEKENEIYYHIYFNNNKKKKKRNYKNKNEQI